MTKSTKNNFRTILFLFMCHFLLLVAPFASEEAFFLKKNKHQYSTHLTPNSTSPIEKVDAATLQPPSLQQHTIQHKLSLFLQSIPLIMSRMSTLEAPLMKMLLKAQQETSLSVLMALEQDRVGLKVNQKKGLFTFTKSQKKSQEIPKSIKKPISNYTLYEAYLKEEKQKNEITERLIVEELKGLLQTWVYRTLSSSEGGKTQMEPYRRFYPQFTTWLESLIFHPIYINYLSQLKEHLVVRKTRKKDIICDESILNLLNYLLIDSLHTRARDFHAKFLPYYLDLRATYGVTLCNLVEELIRENDILSQASEILKASQKKSTPSGLLAYFSYGSQQTTELDFAPIVQKHGHFPPYKQIARLSPHLSQIKSERIMSHTIKLKTADKIEESHSLTLEEDLEHFLKTSTQQTYAQVREEVLEEIRKPRQWQKRVVSHHQRPQSNHLQQAAALIHLERNVLPSLSVTSPQIYIDDVLKSLQQMHKFYESSAIELQAKRHEEDEVSSQCLLLLRRNLIFQFDENNVWQLSLRPNFNETWVFIYSVDIFNKQFPEERNSFQTKLEKYIAVIPILEGFFDQIFELEVNRIIENAKLALLFNMECQHLSSGRPFPPSSQHPAIMKELFDYHCSLNPGVSEAIQRQEANVYIGDFQNSPTYETDRKILRSFIEGIFRKNVVECLKRYNFTEEKVVFLKKVIAEKNANASQGSANYHNEEDTKVTIQMSATIRNDNANITEKML